MPHESYIVLRGPDFNSSKYTLTATMTETASKSTKLSPKKATDLSPPKKRAQESRPQSIAPRKASSSAANPSTSDARPDAANPKKAIPKLGPRKDSGRLPASAQSHRPSLTAKKASDFASTPTDQKRKPPKLPPKKKNGNKTQGANIQKPAHDINEEAQDLKSLLTESQCEDLVLLTSSIMSQMRKTVEKNFDASALLNKISQGNAGEDSFANVDYDPGNVDVSAYDKERKLRGERLKELSTPKMKELEKAALRWIDDWRTGFQHRVNEAVSPEKPAQAQLETPRDASSNVALLVQKIDPGKERVDQAPPKLAQLFPRVPTSLTKMPIARRVLILHSFLLLLLSLEHYNAASRVFLLYLTSSLKLGLKHLREDEEKTAKGLLEAAKQISASQETLEKGRESEESRKWKLRLATVAGAAIVGLSGGYAAPMIAASFGAMMSELGLGASAAAGYLGAVAGNTYLVGSLFGAYGGRMTGEVMRNLSADVQDFAFLPVHGERKEHGDTVEAATDSRRLRVIIAISGWLLKKEEVVTPWRVLLPSAEVFALRFELETLMNLGQSFNTMASSSAYGYAQSAFVARSAYTDLSSSIWPLALVKLARVVENPFTLAKARAEKAGKVLAEALINRTQGERPVTLIGYSLGARVIWSCLTTLADRKAFGIVESVVMAGAPIPSDTNTWRTMRTAVIGRLVNVYSTNDYLLAFLHRASSLQYGVAGLTPVLGLSGVENVDVSETVSGHLRYRYLIGSILLKIGFEDIDKAEVAKEAEAFKRIVEEEKEKDSVRMVKEGAGEIYKQYGKRSKGPTKDKISDGDADKEASAMEKEVQEKTQKGLMQWAAEQLYISRPSLPSGKDVKGKKPSSQDISTDATKDADENVDAASKSMYQRAKEAVYLFRSGPTEEQDVAKDNQAQTENTVSAAAPKSYLASAAEYIPSRYIPGLRAAGTVQDVDRDPKMVQPTKQASEVTKENQQDIQEVNIKMPAAKRTKSASTQSKPGNAGKTPTNVARDANEIATDAATVPLPR